MGRKRRSPEPQEPQQLECTVEQIAAYVGTQAGELSGMAERAGLDCLAYLLKMTELEARNFLEADQAKAA